MQDFIHINVHSHYSIMRSQITIPAAVDKAVADGMKGMALTDLGVMYGIKEFADYCDTVNRKRKHEGLEAFKPIIGCEMYVAPRTMHDKEEGDERCTRLIVLAKNLTGYKNLIKLVSDSWIEGLMGETPRTDFFELEKHLEGLIICSTCLNSVISKRILSGDIDGARNAIVWFKQVWGDDFYMEIQRHEVTDSNQRANRKVFPLQQRINKVLVELAKEYNVKLVCSNNCYFIDEEDGEALDRLHCLATDKELDDSSRKLCTKQEWLKTRKEMNELFMDIPEALSNTLEILNKLEIYSIENDPLLPHFPIPESFGTVEEWRKRFTAIDIVKEFTSDENGNNPMTDDQALAYIKEIKGKWWNIDRMYRVKLQSDYLTKLTYDGAERIYGTLTPQIEERLRFELHHIKKNGFPEYFLFVQDYVNAAQKDLDVWVGPGRGSAVGSLVNYCLGITKVDPLKFGLLFERFYRLNHIALPDIDIDFDADGRGKVLQWIKEKYGVENCANIVAFGKMSSRIAIKDVARMEKLPFGTAEALCQILPPQRYSKDTLNNLLKKENYDGTPEYPELVAAQNCSDHQIANTINYASKIDGTVCATGVHACGFVISPDPIVNHVPLAVSDDPDFHDEKMPITQYDGHTIESTGLIKFDLLGLWTLTEMKECLRLIKENKGIDIDIDHLPLDDEKTFKLYQEGRTIGTFRFESPGMQKYLRELQPTVFEDLVAMNALYRPGPMDYIPCFIERKNGREEITYDLPIMEKYLKETQGIAVYQEQIMHLVREIAGFTRYQSDVIRQALSKRKWDIYNAFKPRFIEGGQKKGYDTHILEKIWSDWDKFGSYFFNKSHAVAYTLIAYQTAYLKANYPKEYMSALIHRRQYDDNELTRLIEECKRMGIKSLSSKVNDVYQNFLTQNTDESIDNYSTDDGTICPHCGNKIEKFDHYCYYSWDGGEWSDLRHEAPQVMVPSIIQHCPHCGNHFAMNQEFMMISDTSKVNFIDPVDFPALIHGAFKYCMPMSEFKWDNPTQEFNQRIRFLWAYNDYFYRNVSEHHEPDEMAKLMHHHNIMELLKFFKNPLMKCDLLRQAGDFDECISQINALMTSAPEDAVPMLNLLKQKAIAKDCAPFRMDESHGCNEEPTPHCNNKGEESSVDDEEDLPF